MTIIAAMGPGDPEKINCTAFQKKVEENQESTVNSVVAKALEKETELNTTAKNEIVKNLNVNSLMSGINIANIIQRVNVMDGDKDSLSAQEVEKAEKEIEAAIEKEVEKQIADKKQEILYKGVSKNINFGINSETIVKKEEEE